jgi:hypothetical protein
VGDSNVKSLLSGDWHLIDWMGIASDLQFWLSGVNYDGKTKWHDFEALTRMHKVMKLTFKMLRLSSGKDLQDISDDDASDGDNAGDSQAGSPSVLSLSFTSLFERIMALQQMAIMPKGSKPRDEHDSNVVSLIKLMLELAGKRWKRQFQGEVNWNANLQKHFLTDTSKVLSRLCKHEKVARQLFEFKETLPSLLGAWEKAPSSGPEPADARPTQRANPPKGQPHLCLACSCRRCYSWCLVVLLLWRSFA